MDSQSPAGMSALLLRQVLLAMREAGAAGIGAVSLGLAEANVPVLVALYLAIVCGAAGLLVLIIRMLVDTATTSPPVWFFLLAGGLGLFPAASVLVGRVVIYRCALFWQRRHTACRANSEFLLPAIMIAAPLILLLLLVISVWPLRSLSKPKWGPLAVLLIVELALIVVTVAFQIRTSWLFQVGQAGKTATASNGDDFGVRRLDAALVSGGLTPLGCGEQKPPFRNEPDDANLDL